MPRKLTGSIYESRGVWYASITLDKNNRESIALPACKTEKQAEARKAIVNDIAQRLRAVGKAHMAMHFLEEAGKRPHGKELDLLLRAVDAVCRGGAVPKDTLLANATMKDIGKMWTEGKLAEQYRDHVKPRVAADGIDGLLEKHVYPHVQHVPVRDFTANHGQMVLDSLPEALDPGSRRNVAKLLNRILNLSVFPLKIITHNPLPKGWLPKPGPAKARSCIYPNEDAQLMACTKVELGLRVLWGYLHREGHRKDEALHLVWNDFDLKLGTINLDKNKTRDARFWKLSPGVARLLRAWKAYREKREGKLLGTALVFFAHNGHTLDGRVFHAARAYRAHLGQAGIDRPQLFEHNANRRRVRAHDTRAAFVTVALANDKNEVWISDRTGHTTMSEMKNYRRGARTFAELNLGGWLPLDTLIPELMPYAAAEKAKEDAAASAAATPTAATAAPKPAAANADAMPDAMPTVEGAGPASADTTNAATEQEAAHEVFTTAEPTPESVQVCAAEAASHALLSTPADAQSIDARYADLDRPRAGGFVTTALSDPSGEAEPGPRHDTPGGNVGAIVAARPVPTLGWASVSMAIQRDFPLIISVQSLPTIPLECTSGGTRRRGSRAGRDGAGRVSAI